MSLPEFRLFDFQTYNKDDIVKERKWTTGRDLDGINPFKKKK